MELNVEKYVALKANRGYAPADVVVEELRKIGVDVSVVNRPSTTVEGVAVMEKVVIEVSFNRANIQPHDHIDEEFLMAVTQVIQNQIECLMDISNEKTIS